MSKPGLCYFTPSLSTFSQKDIEILKHDFKIYVFVFAPKRKALTPFTFLQQKLFLLKNTFRSKVYVIQFAGYHSFLPVLFAWIFRKSSVIVAGGTDCVAFPKIHYGNYHKLLLSWFTSFSYRYSSLILPVDDSLVHSENTYDPSQSGSQGILHFNKNLKTPIQVIYNGYDSSEWTFNGDRKKKTFISVSAGLSEQRRYLLKGFDLLLEAAKKFTDCEFTFVGTSELPADVQIPANVNLVPFANAGTLRKLYSEHEFYMQLSISEGFPNAICEAMLCGCIPIASNVAALPKIVDTCGYILEKKSVDELIHLIEIALSSSNSPEKCRMHIIEKFPFENRERDLLKAVKKQLV
jgi:glycosyltransferase involved in cell wall biosynthesis